MSNDPNTPSNENDTGDKTDTSSPSDMTGDRGDAEPPEVHRPVKPQPEGSQARPD